MGTGVQVMFIISLVLWCTTSFAMDDAAATRIPNVGTLSLSMKENPQLCQLCEEFASEALFYLNENETQTEIIDTLHQACSKFRSFKLECTSLVDYYAPLFFTKITSLSPEEFCASLSFCGEVTFIRLPRHEDTCTLCHEVVNEIVTNLEDSDMEMATVTGSSVSQRVQKRYRPELPLITCGKCGQKILMEYKVSKEGVNKGRIFYKCPDRNWDGTGGCTGWYWEEEYIEHIKKSFAHVVEAEGGEAVSRRKKFNDVDQANDLSIIVGIGRELIMLLKCILVLFFLMLVAIVFVVAKLF